MRAEFQVHRLTDGGMNLSREIAEAFDKLLERLEEVCPVSRELSVCRTKLEEACFFAKKAMAKANAAEVL